MVREVERVSVLSSSLAGIQVKNSELILEYRTWFPGVPEDDKKYIRFTHYFLVDYQLLIKLLNHYELRSRQNTFAIKHPNAHPSIRKHLLLHTVYGWYTATEQQRLSRRNKINGKTTNSSFPQTLHRYSAKHKRNYFFREQS